MNVSEADSYKDNGYAWIVLFSCVLGCAIQEGIGIAYGVMVPSIQKELHLNAATVNFIGSMHLGICTIPAPAVMPLIRKFGFRIISFLGIIMFAMGLIVSGLYIKLWVLISFYGVISSIGMGMKYTVEQMAVNVYFDKRRLLANSLYLSGSPLGYFVSAPILTYIVENFGLSETFYFQCGAVVLNGILFCCIKTPNLDDTQQNSDNQASNSTMLNKTVLTNPSFLLFMLFEFLYSFNKLVPLFFIPTLLINKDFTPQQAALAVTIIGISNVTGRLALGLLDWMSANAIRMTVVFSFGCSMAVLIMKTHQTSLYMFYAACGLYGFSMGPILPLGPTCTVNLVGSEYGEFSTALGWNLAMDGLGSLIGIHVSWTFAPKLSCMNFISGPPTVGCIVDYFDKFDEALLLVSIMYAIGSITIIIAEVIRVKPNHLNQYRQISE